MDFKHTYTRTQEIFRSEVYTWLSTHLPESLERAISMGEFDQVLWKQAKAFQQELGSQGWLAPTDPTDWGGGGLTDDHAKILREEMGKKGIDWLLDQGGSALLSAIKEWGSDEQKERYLSILARGEATLWHLKVDVGADLDVSNLGIEAFRDGDDFVVNGQEDFQGLGLWPDHIWTLAVTDKKAPVDESTGAFLIPAGLPGITIHNPQNLVPNQTHRVTFDNVRVPPSSLLGDEAEGWGLMQSTFSKSPDHAYPLSYDQNVSDLLQYARETVRGESMLSEEPFLQQLLVEAYITSQITRLFRTRNAWMVETGQDLTYQIPQTALWQRQSDLRFSEIIRDVMGIYAFLSLNDSRSPKNGRFERLQRHSLAQQSPVNSPDGQADAIADELDLGISYKKQNQRIPIDGGLTH